jgi:fumarylpyruvate hydrolase
MGTLTKIEESGNMDSGKITLTVNGDVKQDGNLNQIIWKIPRMIAHLSTFYDITAGDIIMTGTPAGVGPVVKGDKLVGTIDKLNPLEIIVV